MTLEVKNKCWNFSVLSVTLHKCFSDEFYTVA